MNFTCLIIINMPLDNKFQFESKHFSVLQLLLCNSFFFCCWDCFVIFLHGWEFLGILQKGLKIWEDGK